jgi:hypothetical protein
MTLENDVVEILKYSLPLIGVVIGWALMQIGEWFKVAREDRRKIKKTIFFLLEVRHHLNLFTGDEEGISKYISILRKKASFLPKEVSDDQIAAAISMGIKGVIKERPLITEDDLKNLTLNYSKSVDSLSEIDPFLAFRLYGRNNVHEILKELAQRMKVSVVQFGDPKHQGEIDKAIDKIGPSVVRGLLADLEEIVLQLAKKIDRKTFNTAKRRLSMPMTKERQKELEKFVEKIVKGMLETTPQ